MHRHYPDIELPPELADFRKRFLAAINFTGLYGDMILFYRLRGQKVYGRMPSSLTGERVKTNKEFCHSMTHAGYLAKASQILKPIYKEVSPDWRCRDVYHILMSVAMQSVREGLSNEGVNLAIKGKLNAMGYRETLPVWSLPPNLAQWLEEEKRATALKPTGIKTQKRPFRFTERALGCRPKNYYTYNASRMATNFASTADVSGMPGKVHVLAVNLPTALLRLLHSWPILLYMSHLLPVYRSAVTLVPGP